MNFNRLMMRKLDAFRPRLRNWALVYRDRAGKNESNIMLAIRAIRKDVVAPQADEVRQSPDVQDANLIESYITNLLRENADFRRFFKVFKIEYLTKTENFDSIEDECQAKRLRARRAGVFLRDYDDYVIGAEMTIMNYAVTHED